MPDQIQTQVSLASHTTLGVGGGAEYFAKARTLSELRAFVYWANSEKHPLFILGGGSNLLVPEEGIRGLVVHPAFHEVTYKDVESDVHVTAGAGVVLDELIENLAAQGLWGLENLSGIPGTVGGVPIQNVGAYGVEAKDVVLSVEAYNPITDSVEALSNPECAFTYRDSYFKREGKHLIITSVTFRVSRVATPKLSYKDLAARFSDEVTPSLQDVRDAVLLIRSKKFPDWRVVGTAGSFFKNPIIPAEEYEKLRATYPELPGFPTDDGRVKVSLGWILDHVCNLRGYTEESVGLYSEQALVLICAHGTSPTDVMSFSEKIIARVYEATGIVIEREVTIVKNNS